VQNDGIDKFNSGLGAVLAVDPLMDGWCSRGPAVDPAYGPRWTGAKGSNPPPRSNLDRRSQIDRLGWPTHESGDRAAALGAGLRRPAGNSPAFARNRARELRLQRGWAQNEEGEKTNSLRGLGRWLGRRRGHRGRRGGRRGAGERREVLRFG
jgi:hypothetical protein